MTVRSTLLSLALAACANDTAPPDRDPVGPAEQPPARRVRRLTADQFVRSLEVATGQTWSRYKTYAGALGKADFGELTDEGRELSVTFDKLVHDAARETCGKAVDADVTTGRVVLRHVRPSDRDHAATVANLQYLMLRFLGVVVDDPADPRLAPWLGLLEAPPEPAGDADVIARWKAVCIGLATHPDFLTY